MSAPPKRLAYSVVRSSYFDLSEPGAGVHKCEMKGLYIMMIMISSMYIFASAYLKFTTEGSLLEQSFFWAMVKDGELVIVVWPCIFLYAWLAFGLQLMILKGLPQLFANIFQHTSQGFMFLVASYVVLTRDWGLTQTLYITALSFTHFMKMHSYTQVNRDLREEWLKNPKDSPYPKNLTMGNFLMYLVAPVLVYQTEYPRIPKFRIGYFLKKALLMSVQIITIYIIIADHILPVIRAKESFFTMWMKLIVPCLTCYIMNFFILFEQILNLFAELACFGDREFYQDWWNSGTFADFARKWNRPVHLFLYRHIYLELKERHKFSEKAATFTTFLFSSLCHELIAALICRTVRPYLLSLMMFQLPLVVFVKLVGKLEFGLYLFWSGIISGPPLLCSLYVFS